MNHRAKGENTTGVVSDSSVTARTSPARGRGRRPSTARRSRPTAADYVARMDLPELVREPLGELAGRFDERLFLPTIGDVRNFLLFCDYDGAVPKARGAAVSCVFKLLARMDPGRVATICDERMFSGPANMLSIADAIGHASSGVRSRSIEIHVEMLLAPAGDLDGLRRLLIEHASEPWRHLRERSSQIAARSGRDALAFGRWADETIPESEVVLGGLDAGFRLSNVVPVIQGDKRDVSAWNVVVEDFIDRVVRPAVNATRHQLTVGPRWVAMRDLTSADAERTLRRFSDAANHSTGSSHPRDEQRWMEFVIACVRVATRRDCAPLTPTLDGGLLRRWLTEVDGWTGDVADDLVHEYEFGFGLIQRYAQKQ